MITTLALLALTPSALATPPLSNAAHVQKSAYDWQTQTTQVEGSQKAGDPKVMMSTFTATYSFNAIDDWNSD